MHAWEHRGNKLHHQAKREPYSAAAELPTSFGLCKAKCTMVTRALSLKAFGTPQNLLQSPARDQFCTVLLGGGCLSQQDRMGLPVPVSSMAWLLRGAAAALPGLGHWMLVLERASSPFPLLSHCVTPLSVEESRAALEQRVGFPQRAVPVFGRQGCGRSKKGGGEWRAWPGGATGGRSVVGRRFARL